MVLVSTCVYESAGKSGFASRDNSDLLMRGGGAGVLTVKWRWRLGRIVCTAKLSPVSALSGPLRSRTEKLIWTDGY